MSEDTPFRAEQLRRRIDEAFADVPYPGDDEIAYDRVAWECPELNANFKGWPWREVPRAVLRHHWDNLSLFSPAGHQFYLPAYLVAALDDLDLRDALLSHFSVDSEHPEILASKYARFTSAQLNAVRAFLEFMRDQYSDELTRRFWSEPLDRYFGRF